MDNNIESKIYNDLVSLKNNSINYDSMSKNILPFIRTLW